MWNTASFRSPFGDTLVLSELHGERDAATVLMFAGFTSRRLNATNTQLAARLQPLGVRSVACDLSGHGDSTGDIKDQTISKAAREIEAALAFVRTEFHLDASHPIGLVGNSFSANAAILAAARSDSLSAMALKSPVTDYISLRAKMLGESDMRRWRDDGYIVLPDGTRSDYAFVEDALAIDTYAELAKIRIPVFAVQGSEDAEIPRESRERLQALMGELGMTYVLMKGGDHNLSDPHFEPVMIAMAEFLSSHLGVGGSPHGGRPPGGLRRWIRRK